EYSFLYKVVTEKIIKIRIMKKVIGVALICFLIKTGVSAQVKYNLQLCIDTALVNNIAVQQSGLLTDAAKVNLKQARANLLPNLNAGLDHGVQTGRSIDPYTNTYADQSVRYAGYGASSGVVLFNGMNLQNNIKQNRYAYNASAMELQQDKDNLTLNVILAYLLVLNNEDQLSSAKNQKALSLRQLERLQIMDSMGAVSPSQVSDLKGQTMNDELTILNLNNQLETSKLALAQLMNVPYSTEMSLERMDADEFLTADSRSPGEIFGTALKQFPLVRSVELRKQSAKFALRSARGALYPTLSLSGNAQTNYSSSAQNATGKIAYNQQVKNNVFTTVNLGMTIPIFNYFRAKNNIKLAAINYRNTELIEKDTKNKLHQQIEQAHLNMTSAYESYKTLLQQVDAYVISFKAAEIRFASGVGTSVDYLTAKNNLDRSNINLISSKYDFVLRKKVLDYYQNEIK
ncbi:MAG: TolC family protein, partial [Ferruginibacter sp.]